MLLAGSLLLSCQHKAGEAPNNSKTDITTKDSSSLLQPGCYRMVIKRDTAQMKIDVAGATVSGDLIYNPFETDGNFGKFLGRIEDGNIRAWYKFESEGMISYREVVYKITPDGLAEGYGDVEVSNDSAWFKYPQALKFENDHLFKKVQCE